MAPRVEIEYCTGCRFLLRAGWLAQELLTTFEAELGEVALIPGHGYRVTRHRVSQVPVSGCDDHHRHSRST